MADTRGIRAGRAFIELGVSDKLSAGLKAAQKKLEAFGAGLRSIGTKMAGIGVAERPIELRHPQFAHTPAALGGPPECTKRTRQM